ncbi:MAG: GGDEF domain-containing protein [Deltaproteobacteria bacterium]|nr:GGDEF domain-containing protein [Deltaproteobacteria bacterium]
MAPILAKSQEIARKILPTLSKFSIPVTPTNYRLWYAYYAEKMPILNETLDRLARDGVIFTPTLSEAIYRRFFSLEATEGHSRVVGQAGEQLKAMAADVAQTLSVSMDQTSSYSLNLDSCLKKAAIANNAETIQDLMSVIIAQTGMVIESQETLHQKLERAQTEVNKLQEELRRREEQVNTDELTGLNNRRSFNFRLAEEISRSKRYGGPLALILLDLDDFKDINDRYGHLVGDRVLMVTAKAIRLAVRSIDFAARFGGEEFAVICPQTDMIGAQTTAERLRAALDNTYFTVKGSAVHITISGGVACLSGPDSMDDLIDRADQFLYIAKKAGKNKIYTEMDCYDELEHPAECQ